MIVGVFKLDLFIHASASLKEKRFVVKSIKDGIRHKFNVSIAETGHLDKWQRAELGISMVANEEHLIRSTMEAVMLFIEAKGQCEMVNRELTMY
ncbi:MAG TPA: DUF503 domain-containing protein [bacterium]|nr:DUF503 domain-containing protein [bacterium]